MYCTHCGARQATGIRDPAAYRTIAERYALVERQAGFARAMEWRPRLSAAAEIVVPAIATVAVAVYFVGFLAVARVVDAPPLFHWAAWGIGTISVVSAFLGLVRGVLRVAAPTRRSVMVVMEAGEGRPRGRGVGADQPLRLRDRDGDEHRCLATGELTGLIAAGDIGLAYTQRDRLVDFRRFEVMPAQLEAGEPPRVPGCPACAAPMTVDTRTHCSFCGEALPDPDLGEFGATFTELAGRADTRVALERTVRGGVPSLVGPTLLLAGGLLALLVIWRLRVLLIWAMDSSSPWFALVFVPPLASIARGAQQVVRRRAAARAPYLRALALIVRRRRVQWGEINGRPQYDDYLTLAFASGARRELRVAPQVWDRLPERGFGVAHLRGEWLVAFDPVG